MKIISIDPGYERVGIAILEKNQNERKEVLLYSECFKTSKDLERAERIHLIAEHIEFLIQEHTPEKLAIESLFFKNNKTTGMGVAEARGAITSVALRNGVSVHEILPIHVKTAVAGYGRATKTDIHKMTAKLIQLPNKKMIDDEVDAIAIGLTYFAIHRFS